jgi:hypothetical protein
MVGVKLTGLFETQQRSINERAARIQDDNLFLGALVCGKG